MFGFDSMRQSLASIWMAVLLSFAEAWAAEVASGRARVIDGDTIAIGRRHIRFSGIDAPEIGQRCKSSNAKSFDCGLRAKRALEELVTGRDVVCQLRGRDANNRDLAVCWADHGAEIVNLNERLVAVGFAFAHTKYDDSYQALEAMAKSKRAGLWAGEFAFPWSYRERQKPIPNERRSAPPLALVAPECPATRPYCKDVHSCARACFLLTQCGFGALDRDHDGIPCENVCRKRCP